MNPAVGGTQSKFRDVVASWQFCHPLHRLSTRSPVSLESFFFQSFAHPIDLLKPRNSQRIPLRFKPLSSFEIPTLKMTTEASAVYAELDKRPIEGTICLFDVDGTLTPARRVCLAQGNSIC
jgi:hypothetical protein